MACTRGCCATQADHYRSISFQSGPSETTLMGRRWHADMPAYQRLRKNGLQPKGIDGCAALEAKANTTFEIASGQVITDPRERRLVERVHQEIS